VRPARRLRAIALCALLALAPIAHADDECRMALGRGWPPATENHGVAVETLFAGATPATLRVTVLPATGEERGVLLMPGADGADWTLRHAQAEERVRVWQDGKLQLRTSEAPEVNDVPIPARVATRLQQEWHALLASAAPEGSAAPFSEGDTWTFLAGDLRVSGLEPGCDLGELLRDQVDLLIEASDEGPEKRERRWRALEQSLDRLARMREAAFGATQAP
jgi:hypothetical protein